MLISVTKNSIKIILMGVFALTELNAADIKECASPLNPNAKEFIPYYEETRAQTLECGVSMHDAAVDPMCDVPVDPIWMYYNWTYWPSDYPDDMKPTKKIKNLLKEHRKILANESLAAFAQSYIALGDAHTNHLWLFQRGYYSIALNIGYQIDDNKIIENACIAFGNMFFTNRHYVEGISWYHEAYKIGNTDVVGVVRKMKKEITRNLKDKYTPESLTQNQIDAINEFFPHLAPLYCKSIPNG